MRSFDLNLRPIAYGIAAIILIWSLMSFFFTVDAGERDAFLARHDEKWIDEGVDCYVFGDRCLSGLSPVHRFYSPEHRAYFYTIQPDDVRKLVEVYREQWQHEEAEIAQVEGRVRLRPRNVEAEKFRNLDGNTRGDCQSHGHGGVALPLRQ